MLTHKTLLEVMANNVDIMGVTIVEFGTHCVAIIYHPCIIITLYAYAQ